MEATTGNAKLRSWGQWKVTCWIKSSFFWWRMVCNSHHMGWEKDPADLSTALAHVCFTLCTKMKGWWWFVDLQSSCKYPRQLCGPLKSFRQLACKIPATSIWAINKRNTKLVHHHRHVPKGCSDWGHTEEGAQCFSTPHTGSQQMAQHCNED